MTRSALVIGLGGTGQWVLSYLKKDLIESNNGEMPSNVRLLCFDTLPQAGAELAAAATQKGEKEVKVGSVQLEKNKEFVHLGGAVDELSRYVCEDSKKDKKDQHYSHISSWFQAGHWLDNLPTGSFVLSSGAGQLRQFGRLALFKDLISRNDSAIWVRLDNAIGELAPGLKGEERLEIIIVGSFAGGTGSGLFIDLALLARHRAKTTPILIRGFFVLPKAFDPDADDEMLARSFAAWRELNRFMVVNQDFALPEMIYNSDDPTLQIRDIKNKAYDACYLVDGIRNGARVAAETELGVHPTIADVISAILDVQAGGKYTEYAANLAKVYATKPGQPLYSVIGSHSFKVPVYYAQQDFSHRFTVNWLKQLVKPVLDKETGQVTGVEATSPIDPSRTGREEALSLLTSPQEYDGSTEDPTLYYNRIADILGEGGANDPTLVEQYARGSWGGRAWLDVFTNLGNRQDMVEVISRIRQEAKLRVEEVVKTSKVLKESPRNFPRRVENTLPAFFKEHYGFRTAGGEENTGSFGRSLEECASAQIDIFIRLTNLWLSRTMMSGDKSGRLGYAYDLMDGLSGKLTGFLDFMEKVKIKRQEIQPYLKTQEEREKQKKAMLNYAGRKYPSILPLFDHPRAHATQVTYLKAEQAVVDARKDELLQASIVKAARDIQSYCNTVRSELERWIHTLVTGDPGSQVQGLYPLLERQRREIEKTRAADEKLSATQTRLGDLSYPAAQEKEELKRLMEGVKWSIGTSDGGLKIQLNVEPSNLTAAKLEIPASQASSDVKAKLTQRNLKDLQSYAILRFSELPEETRVVEKLRNEFTPQTLTNYAKKKISALFDKSPHAQGGAARWSELIRVSLDNVKPEMQSFISGKRDQDGKLLENGLLQEMRVHSGLSPEQRDLDRLVDVVGSADNHKCTIVRTDDLMPVELFRAWEDCKSAYLRHKSQMSPHLNHNFPAEANAARYEWQAAKKWAQIYRIFHPWVVMLLEYEDRLNHFFMCWALGWVKIQDDGASSRYELHVPGFTRPFWLTPNNQVLYSPFQAARYFVLEGIDRRPNSTLTLDYHKIEAAMQAEERTRGGDSWMEFLKDQTAEYQDEQEVDEMFVHKWLRAHIKDLEGYKARAQSLPSGEPVDFAQAYNDLADVARLMLEERMERKEVQLGRQARNRPAAPPEPIG